MKILLVQLGSNGDCMFVTTIAKQIKEIDYSGCSLTWMIGSSYSDIIENNPFIDQKIIIPIKNSEDLWYKRNNINVLLNEYKNQFDKVFITDFTIENKVKRFGTTRSTLFRCYPHKIIIDPSPQIFLTKNEVDEVTFFCKKNNISKIGNNILFECSPQSGQSKITLESAIKISDFITSTIKGIRIIITSSISFTHHNANIIDASSLSIRENAELVNYCKLMIGCSSGITWLATSTWVKKIPMIQIISPHFKNKIIPASVKTDYLYLGLDLNNIIELYDPSSDLIIDTICETYNTGFISARLKFDQFTLENYRNYRLITESKMSIFKKIYLLNNALIQSNNKYLNSFSRFIRLRKSSKVC